MADDKKPEKKDEPKKSRREVLYDKKKGAEKPASSATQSRTGEEALRHGDLEKPPERIDRRTENKTDDKKPEAQTPHEKHAADRAALNKQHESERRDTHGNHREELRKMASRQEKAHKELAERQMAELASGPSAAAPAAPAEAIPDQPVAPAATPA